MTDELAVKESPDLLLLPENFPFWGSRLGKEINADIALDFLRSLAADFSLNLVGGSFHRRDESSGKYLNTSFVLNRKGDITGFYHKRKLFHRELNSEVLSGDKPAVFNIEGWRVAVQICADFWFPELSREILGSFDIIAVPAQSVVRSPEFQTYGRVLWHNLALTRAQENAAVTIVADHPAFEQAPFCSGGSSICDPSLSMMTADLAEIHRKTEGKPGAVCLTIDLERLKKFRLYRAERGILPEMGQGI